MADIFYKIRKAFLTVGLGIGVMLALPGCGKEDQIADFYTQEAQDINELKDAVENGDISKVNKFVIDTKKQEKKLAKELKSATKKQRKGKEGPDPDEISNKINVLENQIKAAESAKKLIEGEKVPRSGIIGDAQDLVEGAADKVEEGYSDWILREIIMESRDYANTNPEYEGIADAFESLGYKVQEKTNGEFLVDDEAAKEKHYQEAMDKAKNAHDKFTEGLQDFTQEAGETLNNAAEKAGEAANEEIGKANRTMEYYLENGLDGGEQEDGEVR